MTTKEFEIQNALGTLTFGMKISLTSNKRTSKKILTILSIDKHWYVRCWVASHSNTSKEALTKLSTDKDSGVRYWVAENHNTPKETLKKLSIDDENNSVKVIASYTLKNINKGNK